MGKPSQKRRLGDDEAMAVGTPIRTSPRKLALAADMIQGLDCAKALVALSFSHKSVARDVKKILDAAIANAENNHGLDVDTLYVAEASVGKQVLMKRLHARARGRAGSVEKFFSRIRIVVRERRAVDAAEGSVA